MGVGNGVFQSCRWRTNFHLGRNDLKNYILRWRNVYLAYYGMGLVFGSVVDETLLVVTSEDKKGTLFIFCQFL